MRHLAGIEAALATLPPTLRAKLIYAPGAVHRCYLYPDTINAETGAANDGFSVRGTAWVGYGDHGETLAGAIATALADAQRRASGRPNPPPCTCGKVAGACPCGHAGET